MQDIKKDFQCKRVSSSFSFLNELFSREGADGIKMNHEAMPGSSNSEVPKRHCSDKLSFIKALKRVMQSVNLHKRSMRRSGVDDPRLCQLYMKSGNPWLCQLRTPATSFHSKWVESLAERVHFPQDFACWTLLGACLSGPCVLGSCRLAMSQQTRSPDTEDQNCIRAMDLIGAFRF